VAAGGGGGIAGVGGAGGDELDKLNAMQMPDCGMATQVGKQGNTLMFGSRLLVALIKAKTKGKHKRSIRQPGMECSTGSVWSVGCHLAIDHNYVAAVAPYWDPDLEWW